MRISKKLSIAIAGLAGILWKSSVPHDPATLVSWASVAVGYIAVQGHLDVKRLLVNAGKAALSAGVASVETSVSAVIPPVQVGPPASPNAN